MFVGGREAVGLGLGWGSFRMGAGSTGRGEGQQLGPQVGKHPDPPNTGVGPPGWNSRGNPCLAFIGSWIVPGVSTMSPDQLVSLLPPADYLTATGGWAPSVRPMARNSSVLSSKRKAWG